MPLRLLEILRGGRGWLTTLRTAIREDGADGGVGETLPKTSSLPLEREQGLLSFQVCCRSSSFPLDVYKETAEHGIPTGEALAPPPPPN